MPPWSPSLAGQAVPGRNHVQRVAIENNKVVAEHGRVIDCNESRMSQRNLDTAILKEKLEDLSRRDASEWERRNSNAAVYIKLSFADHKALTVRRKGRC
ncbi:hypothetical protein TNCV_397261 [Trichonephila clavipes]|nr:hypothetical protein TNCV_397261 [Trichonephila clavipes]